MPKMLHTGQVIIDLVMAVDKLPQIGGDVLAQSLALAAVCVLVADPASVLAPGFWLSFLGVAWLAWCLPFRPGEGWLRPQLASPRELDMGIRSACYGLFKNGKEATEVLRALGPQGLLVNVARGSVVDEAALIACLQSGELGGAALDVFDDEPRVPAALLTMDQVVLAPHMASGTHDTRQAMADLTLANLRAGLAGEPLPACAV